MNQPIKPESQAVARVIAAINGNPGLSTIAIAEAAKYSPSHTQNVLAVATKTGAVKAMHIKGRLYGWFPIAQAREMIATRQAAKAAEDARKAAKPIPDRERIRLMAAEPEGVSSAQIKALGIKHHSSSRHMVVLIQRGHIFRSDRTGCRLRWFDTKDRADDWAALPAVVPSEWEQPGKKAWADHPARKRRMVEIGERLKSSARQPSKAPPKLKGSQGNIPGDQLVVKAKPGKSAPVSIKAQPKAPPDFSRAKITRIEPPKFDCRWQQQPDSGQSIFADWPRYGAGA